MRQTLDLIPFQLLIKIKWCSKQNISSRKLYSTKFNLGSDLEKPSRFRLGVRVLLEPEVERVDDLPDHPGDDKSGKSFQRN